ncbi:MAG: hypothetical protein IKU66_05225 [Clostridia bacterium]|nr:hypothetical protein [Clostridia bacterium]
MAVNYNDKRFTQVNNEKAVALKENETTYNNMINNSDKYYQAQIDASKDWANTQTQLQNEQTDFAIEKIEQQKKQAHDDYIKEQSGAYHDWQKQSNRYGVNAEIIASKGLTNSGYAESSQVAMYVAYQNRVATARESYNRAVLNYDNAMTEARMQNKSTLAEIAYNSLQQQLELSLQGFQYKNTLVLQKAQTKREIDNTYYSRYQDVLNQINTENALAEQRRQADIDEAYRRDVFNWEKSQASKYSGGTGGKLTNTTGKKVVGESTGLKQTNNVDYGSYEPTVDMASVTALGYGPISASKLNSLVASGEVIEYEENGKLKYKRKTASSSKKTTTSNKKTVNTANTVKTVGNKTTKTSSNSNASGKTADILHKRFGL